MALGQEGFTVVLGAICNTSIFGRNFLLNIVGLTTRSKKLLLGAPGIATRSKDATRGSWPYY